MDSTQVPFLGCIIPLLLSSCVPCPQVTVSKSLQVSSALSSLVSSLTAPLDLRLISPLLCPSSFHRRVHCLCLLSCLAAALNLFPFAFHLRACCRQLSCSLLSPGSAASSPHYTSPDPFLLESGE